MNQISTIPTRRQLERDAMHDALLRADMRNEAAGDYVAGAANRVFRWVHVFGAIGLPIICWGGVTFIRMWWPL